MLELGKDVMVLKKGGVKIKKILDFPSMNMMSCDDPTKDDSDTISNGFLGNEDENANNFRNPISLLDETATIEDDEDSENGKDDAENSEDDSEQGNVVADDGDEEEYLPPAKKQKTQFVTPRRKTRSSKAKNSP
eukprot:g5044.t1